MTYPDGKVKEYLFGGDYSYEGSKAPTPVVVSQDSTGISAVWTVEGITFTQRIELANVGSNEHGMVRIAYSVSSAQPLSDVKVRILLDTALGMRDYAYYEVIDEYKFSKVYRSETVLQASAQYIPANFFAYDDPGDPSIVAYVVNADLQPYQVAFAHWNNLASTLFGFAPDPNLTFTTQYNFAYQTADSACALYYDLGAVSPDKAVSMSASYGVYSNEHVTSSDSAAINVTAPTALTLTPDKKSYQAIGQDAATFTVLAGFTNIERDGAEAYERVAVAVYCSNGITPLDDTGKPYLDYSYSNPYVVQLLDLKVGETRPSLPFSFNAQVGSEASYRKVEFRVFRLNKKPDGMYDMTLLKENLLGATSLHILCPGGDGDLPKVTFTGASPKILYYEGNRRLTLTGNNFHLLEDKSKYELILTGPTSVPPAFQQAYKVPPGNISFSKADPDAPSPGIMEAIIEEKMPPGDYVISLEFGATPPEGFPESLTAPALRVTMSDNPVYKNDTYGIIAAGR